MAGSGLYVGKVHHRRLRPRVHALVYRVFMLVLDIDELDALFARSRLLRRGRFGLMSLDPSDFGDRSGRPLRAQIEAVLAEAGLGPVGRIRLMTMPRILGYGFNPISVWFCDRPDGQPAAILYEVSNTFGERHSYLVGTPDATAARAHRADKRFHVSPFMDMDQTYDFRVRAPDADGVSVAITVSDADGPMLTASFAGERRDLDDAGLLKAWITHPLLTLKVIAGIHWEALWIWLKGVGYRRKPPPPERAVSLGRVA